VKSEGDCEPARRLRAVINQVLRYAVATACAEHIQMLERIVEFL
jgi:hypothetical protein